MKSGAAHELQDVELVEELKKAREEAFNLRLRHANSTLEDTASLGRARRDLARLLTIARQRNIDLEREQGS
ncbi:MAG: 50S ribosomal protein L29 [Solirubrobacterales bacterium]|nr:50S ribosomal protein L29 [Solirubrobacterales bacterium]